MDGSGALASVVVSLFGVYPRGWRVVKLTRENWRAAATIAGRMEMIRFFDWDAMNQASLTSWGNGQNIKIAGVLHKCVASNSYHICDNKSCITNIHASTM